MNVDTADLSKRSQQDPTRINYTSLDNLTGSVHIWRGQVAKCLLLLPKLLRSCSLFSLLCLKFIPKGGRWGLETQQTNSIFLAS